jgi:hypothetical protein
VNPLAREALGDEIYFRDRIPWIWGSIDQWHGRIDVHFGVKGTRQAGIMRFKSERRPRMKFVSFRIPFFFELAYLVMRLTNVFMCSLKLLNGH